MPQGAWVSSRHDSRAVCREPSWESQMSQKLPVPALLLPRQASPTERWPRHLISDKISSSVLMLYRDFPFSARSGGKKVACKIPQKVRFWAQALGSTQKGWPILGCLFARAAEGHAGTQLSARIWQHPQRSCSSWKKDGKTCETLPGQYDLGF